MERLEMFASAYLKEEVSVDTLGRDWRTADRRGCPRYLESPIVVARVLSTYGAIGGCGGAGRLRIERERAARQHDWGRRIVVLGCAVVGVLGRR
jgi:hypothetical protein